MTLQDLQRPRRLIARADQGRMPETGVNGRGVEVIAKVTSTAGADPSMARRPPRKFRARDW
jgi:hypothetical protein